MKNFAMINVYSIMSSNAEGGQLAEIIMLQTRESTNRSPTFLGQNALLLFRKYQQQHPWSKINNGSTYISNIALSKIDKFQV